MRQQNERVGRPPSTRSAAVPFESADLLGARVCKEPADELVAWLPDLTANGSRYAIPWSALPQTIPMGRYDTALHRRVTDVQVASPAAIEAAAQDVAASGVAGGEAKTDEMARRFREKRRHSEILGVLAMRLVSGIGLLPEGMERQAVSREQLSASCLRRGLWPDRLAESIDQCADLIMPMGLSDDAENALIGPLRALATQLHRIPAHFASRAAAVRGKDRRHYLAARDGALAAVEQADEILSAVDRQLGQIIPTLARWTTASTEIAAAIELLRDVLDGWETVVTFHAGVPDLPPDTAASRPAVLASLIPELPSVCAAQPRRSMVFSA